MKLTDLHTHTTESDGTLTPEELVRAAVESGIGTLAITDHDHVTEVDAPGLELIRGIELTCKHDGRPVHLLGYFFGGDPGEEFAGWMAGLLAARRERNRRLAERLQGLGVNVSLEEVERHGRKLAGRPHFARVLIEKGYAANSREAFDKYIGESGVAYVERDAPGVREGIEHIARAGGVSSAAHPIRIRGDQERAIAEFANAGLSAIEAFHSDHSAADTERFIGLGRKYGLALSGGSDFHGATKPEIELGRGIRGSLHVPEWVAPGLRARALS